MQVTGAGPVPAFSSSAMYSGPGSNSVYASSYPNTCWPRINSHGIPGDGVGLSSLPGGQNFTGYQQLHGGYSQQPLAANAESMEASDDVSEGREEGKRKEIYGWDAPFNLYALAWSHSADPRKKFRLAAGSFIEEYSNKITVVQLDEGVGDLVPKTSFDHPYPATKLLWLPDTKGQQFPDLLATTGDYLRIWKVHDDGSVRIEALLNTNRTSEYCAPLTSFDWNDADVHLIATSSIDTTCTVWNVETQQAVGGTNVEGSIRTQLIAHDREVFDVAWSGAAAYQFASVGADGSLRIFDLRHLEHSTIVFEQPTKTPLLRLAWNKQDYHYIATFAQDSNEVIILDVRVPCSPLARLNNHRGPVNGMSWAPHSSCHICTAGEDSQALIWDVHEMPRAVDDPILAYQAAGPVNQVHWAAASPDWISICYGNRLEILRV